MPSTLVAPRPPQRRPHGDPQEAFAELGRIVLGDQPLGRVLHRVAELAASCVPGADEVSVTLVEGSTARSAAFTGPAAAALDERQYEAGFGPCMDAAGTGSTVAIADTSAAGGEQRYADFAAAARRQGVVSSLSVGMPVPGRTVGALNLYRLDDRPFDEESVELAQAFAGRAAVALANASLYATTAELAEQMRVAMASRATIEQAKGVLMGRLGLSPEEAFARLSSTSQNTNRKLRDVAAAVVAEVQHRA